MYRTDSALNAYSISRAQSSPDHRTDLDELIRNFRRDIHAFGITVPSLFPPSLRLHILRPSEVVCPRLGTRYLGALLGGEGSAVEYDIGLDAVVPEHADAVHGIVDEPGRLFAFHEVFGTSERAFVQPHICLGSTSTRLAE